MKMIVRFFNLFEVYLPSTHVNVVASWFILTSDETIYIQTGSDSTCPLIYISFWNINMFNIHSFTNFFNSLEASSPLYKTSESGVLW